LAALQAHNSASLKSKIYPIFSGAFSMSNIPKIQLRNSLTECGQSIRKENAGKYQNYTIKDCIASIAASKIK